MTRVRWRRRLFLATGPVLASAGVAAAVWLGGSDRIDAPAAAVAGGGAQQQSATTAPSRSPAATASVIPPTATVVPPTATPILPAPTPAPATWRPKSVADVRLWANGDSTSYFLSLATMDWLRSLGATTVQPFAEYKISSGLVRRDFFDWYAYFDQQMAAYSPNVVVFMVGANDALQGISIERYRELVGEAMDRLKAPERRVVWVGQPNMGRADLRRALPGLNAVFAEEAAKRPWVVYVDAWTLTSDSSGNYAAALPGADGTPQVLRVDDGVHLTPAGGRWLAGPIIDAIFSPTPEEAAEAARIMAAAKAEAAEVAAALTGGR